MADEEDGSGGSGGQDDFASQFLKANANHDYMAGVLADCIRHCMRGVAAGDPSSPAYKATQEFEKLLKLMRHADGVYLYKLFADAIDEVRPKQPKLGGDWRASKYFDHTVMRAAQDGIQFVVESSCGDNAARGRASKRESNFLDAMRRIEEAREEMRKEADARWRATRPAAEPKSRKPKKG